MKGKSMKTIATMAAAVLVACAVQAGTMDVGITLKGNMVSDSGTATVLAASALAQVTNVAQTVASAYVATGSVATLPGVTVDAGNMRTNQYGGYVSVLGLRLQGGYEVSATGENTLALGAFLRASAIGSIALGYGAAADDILSFCWQGTGPAEHPGEVGSYTSHGMGTFSINPVGGLAGVYIGETNLEMLLASYATAQQGAYADGWHSVSGTVVSGSAAGATAVQPGALAAYVPTNDARYLAAITNGAAYATTAALATVAGTATNGYQNATNALAVASAAVTPGQLTAATSGVAYASQLAGYATTGALSAVSNLAASANATATNASAIAASAATTATNALSIATNANAIAASAVPLSGGTMAGTSTLGLYRESWYHLGDANSSWQWQDNGQSGASFLFMCNTAGGRWTLPQIGDIETFASTTGDTSGMTGCPSGAYSVSNPSGFVTASITNGLASVTYVNSQINAATNGLVKASVTNGLAGISYVDNATNALSANTVKISGGTATNLTVVSLLLTNSTIIKSGAYLGTNGVYFVMHNGSNYWILCP